VRLEGEVAIVTGSTSGIGKAIARRFGGEGAAVVVTGRDDLRGNAVVHDITADGGRAVFVAADLTDESAADRLVDTALEHFGACTVLVNNAVAGGRGGAAADVHTEDWDHELRVNLTAPLWCARAAIPEMQRAGYGSIINISSRAGERASSGLAAYTASKGGMNALTRSIAVDYAPDNIRCNTISPGYVLNDVRDADLDSERRARYEAMHLSRLGTADDVAYCALYLASRESEWLTGANIPLDGGGSIARGAVRDR